MSSRLLLFTSDMSVFLRQRPSVCSVAYLSSHTSRYFPPVSAVARSSYDERCTSGFVDDVKLLIIIIIIF